MIATRQYLSLFSLLIVAACASGPRAGSSDAAPHDLTAPSELRLSYDDGRPDTVGVDGVNAALRSVGVRVGLAPLAAAAKPILEASHTRALEPGEIAELLSIFSLNRADLLQEIERAGRAPAVANGGHLTTSEANVPPYPKVYDIRSLEPKVRYFLQEKFGKLHVNSTDEGVGIDEVMTIVSGGPWVWFFALPDGVVAKLTLGYVGLEGPAWRISYPGLVPHGGFLDPEYGLVVAHAHGPEGFVMRYEDPTVPGAKLLGGNPWVDFSGDRPSLLDRIDD